MKLSQAQRRILVLLRDTGKLPLTITSRQLSVLRKAELIGFEKDPIRWFVTEEGREALTRKAPVRAPAQRKPRWKSDIVDGITQKPKPRKPLKKLGKRGLAWKEIREKELLPAFNAAGIKTCEIKGPKCWGARSLGFCHSHKRRNCTTPELMREVVLGCNVCHDEELEILPEAEMAAKVRLIIAKRRVPVALPTPKQ